MKRINTLVRLIDPCDNVIDVGSDHAYLAVNLLKNNIAKFVVNVDINKKPLEQGIINLTKSNLLDKTLNIQNDGLKNLEYNDLVNKEYEYLVVSGLGSHIIIDILMHNKLLINNFILQTNKNEFILREWLYKNKFKIIKETFIEENKIHYPIFVVVKSNRKHLISYENKLLGNRANIENIKSYSEYLIYKKNYIENENINARIKQTKNLKLINKRILWCNNYNRLG